MTDKRRQRRTQDAGFSLMEMLVVVFIIGLLSSVVVMNLPQGRPAVAKAADDIAGLLVRLNREAIMLGEPVRWRHSRAEDVFERYMLGEWTPLSSDRSRYNRLKLDDRVTLQINLVDFAEGRASFKSEDRPPPSIVFLPTGEAVEAQIVIADGANEIRLGLTSSGDVTRSDMER